MKVFDFEKNCFAIHKKIWTKFDSLRFTKGQSHCAIHAFETILQELPNLQQNSNWKLLYGLEAINSFFSQDFYRMDSPYLILVNDQYSSLPFIPTLGNYSLHSGVSPLKKLNLETILNLRITLCV